ncbi:MAG: 3-dehydroquinate synthase [Spirochaetota bacterium]
METIKINTPTPSNVYIGEHILKEVPSILKKTMGHRYYQGMSVLVVTDTNVKRRYYNPLSASLKRENFRVKKVGFRAGERMKSLSNIKKLLHKMLKYGLSRDSVVIGLGGGVVGDFAGFGASIYMRGCNFVLVPTSLLAQVDAAIGGKVGINLPQGKNLAGSFYQPLFVATDTHTLATLPAREMVCGLAEIIKYGFIFDSEVFHSIKSSFWRLVQNKGIQGNKPEGRYKITAEEVKKQLLSDSEFLNRLITTSARIKGEIVQRDEKESGIRMILNFGHTFAHAIEKLTRYRRFLHGEAVMTGMKIAVELSFLKKMINQSERKSALGLLEMFQLPSVRGISVRSIYKQIERDKKKRKKKVNYVLLKKIGYATWEPDVRKKLVLDSIARVLKSGD